MHSLNSWKQSLLFSRPYCSGRAKSGCGGVFQNMNSKHRCFSPPTLCLISWNMGHNHAITIITNVFHKFWCLFDFRNNISKIDPKRTLFGLEGQNPVDRHTFCGILAWDFTSIIQREKSIHSNGVNLKMYKLDPEGLNPYPKWRHPRPWSEHKKTTHPGVIFSRWGSCQCNGGPKSF